jgi:hypothetical protein
MMPYFFDFSELVPFDKKELIDQSKLPFLDRNQDPSYVKLFECKDEIIDYDFKNFIENKLQTKIKRIFNHHWFSPTAYVAHVNCNSAGERSLLALNLVLERKGTYLNFYDEKNIKGATGDINSNANIGGHGEGWSYEANPNLAYDVSNIRPSATWIGHGPCFINPAIPHMVNSCAVRNTISIQFTDRIDINEAVERLLK